MLIEILIGSFVIKEICRCVEKMTESYIENQENLQTQLCFLEQEVADLKK